MEHPVSRLRTVPEWSRILGRPSPKTIRRAIDRGELAAIRVTPTGWPLVAEDAIRSWLGRCQLAAR